MRLAPALALSIAAVLSLGACQQQHDPIVPSPAPSATPVFASDEEALAAAEEAYRAYIEAMDRIVSAERLDISELNNLASPSLIEHERPSINETLAEGQIAIGSTSFDSVTLESADLLGQSREAVVVVYLCEDFGGTDLLDAHGASMLAPDRQTRWPLEVSFDLAGPGQRPLVVGAISDWTGVNFCSIN